MKLSFYAIITREGKLKQGSGGQYAIHTQYPRACFWAKDDGDSVVQFEISLEQEPLFIRRTENGD